MPIGSFKIKELAVVLFCTVILLFTFLLPVLARNEILSRTAVCFNNMKSIGIGLELWRQNSGCYPTWDFALSGGLGFRPWPDMVVLQKGYTPEWIEANRESLISSGIHPSYLIKTIEDDRIFYCPSDHPHPHKINEERSKRWGFWNETAKDGYEYSYGISVAAVEGHSEDAQRNHRYYPHEDASKQILSVDGLWSWAQNFRASYVDDPAAGYDNPFWHSNTVGFFHGDGKEAVVLVRDGSSRRVDYGTQGDGLKINETFFYGPAEDLDVIWF